jgi:NadR type nicotinamide-nucleotide adenylyltransferase
MRSLKKIVAIGPESTGKSTLCALLSSHFQTAWVAEYAREYLLTHGTQYSYEDLLTIARGQLAGEDAAYAYFQAKGKPIFIDTDMYVMKVWSEFVFGKCDPFILYQIAKREYDLYLLCGTDLPWEKDELREYPDQETREKLFLIYKDLLINQSVPWVEIRGRHEHRIHKAIEAVNQIL